MRGLWDGDGTIRNTGTSSIFEQSILMIKAIDHFITVQLGVNNSKITQRVVEGKLIGYDLYFHSFEFYKWMYRNNLDFKMQIKYVRQFN